MTSNESSPSHSEQESIPLTSNNDDADEDDVPLLILDDESASSPNNYGTDSVSFRFQSILYHFLAEPVIKGRVVIIVLYFVILAGTAFLVTKLQVLLHVLCRYKPTANVFFA